MTVYIFTEGGNRSGLGHISRCSSLYDELYSRGITVELIVHSESDQIDILEGRQYQVVNWLSEAFLIDFLTADDDCIVDSYLASKDICEVISNRARKVLFIDDNGRIEYPDGIIVNPSLHPKAVTYPETDRNCYLIGPKYSILRPPFTKAVRESIQSDVKEVLVTMGGSDLHNLTPDILKLLTGDHPSIHFNVVIGSAFHQTQQIKQLTSPNISFFEQVNAEEMKGLMLTSDLAITAAGQTIFECAATRTPFIPVQVIENQHQNMKALIDQKLVKHSLFHNEPEFDQKLKTAFDDMLLNNVRLRLYEKLAGVVDGQGSKRIVDAILNPAAQTKRYFLRNVTNEDMKPVFELSNEDYVRKHSINQSKIEWSDHKNWFKQMIQSEDHVFYVVTDETGQFLGQIRYQLEGSSATVSISLGRALAGKGMSGKLMSESISKLQREKKEITQIIAYVSEDNLLSKKLFERLHFRLKENNHGLLQFIYPCD
ncbi:hypothetical protein JMA_28180 [Jeotgalibacillus malaysiensis]|uniref:N-acetyltransferase domain-containing protein n=1 Tax=Jeotgalibacillus malaysiensis TaxID=1508404 RepID=A0A0B5APE1_9BACL|nr:bifunctional UDP-2,4-diacetamido-2,4,6-trideoxy-beta-L-altropyranose hydrolase/GNAT family N-acetyltransferase [Jeotgalibacillus malaysiensis]AJD92135.1 hypothetical protein JMA_28180 [Jeotgalibacillus malaysiensis]